MSVGYEDHQVPAFGNRRDILIFWDHGGGSISGYGYDELHKSVGSMDLAEISAALKAAGCTFDWIGFDACLMATLETALVFSKYADYLIASEETEPGAGIQSVELNVFVDDGEGFIDLGLDNVFESDGNDLLLEFDRTWLTVNRHVAAFYMDYAGEDATAGHIPAMLTQEVEGDTVTQLVYLEVIFDDANPDGAITGARPMYAEGETATVAKGGIVIREGDVTDFLTLQ